ncbi:hypothetical protein JKP88DRAFT_278389 [Tribonema minus]|uniref:Uncharacterized protein n=1 Tax=Tribonema minus TaxID=303371 RepID=A0A835YUZ5_9STRA|nr:hypothetical protein JKP88DRAFT_278389 [Tribonema minus]
MFKRSFKRSRPGAVSPGACEQCHKGAVFVGFGVIQSSLALHFSIVDMEPIVIEVPRQEYSQDEAARKAECEAAAVEFMYVDSYAQLQLQLTQSSLAVKVGGISISTDMIIASNDVLCPEAVKRAQANGTRVVTGPQVTILSSANTWLVPEHLLARLIAVDSLLCKRTFNQSCVAPWHSSCGAASHMLSTRSTSSNSDGARTLSDSASVASFRSAGSNRQPWSWLMKRSHGAVVAIL